MIAVTPPIVPPVPVTCVNNASTSSTGTTSSTSTVSKEDVAIEFKVIPNHDLQGTLTSNWENYRLPKGDPVDFCVSRHPRFGALSCQYGAREYVQWAKDKMKKIPFTTRIMNAGSHLPDVFGKCATMTEVVGKWVAGEPMNPKSGVQIWMAGGMVNQILDTIPMEERAAKAKLFKCELTPSDDIDLYLVGGSQEARSRRLNELLCDYEQSKWVDYYVSNEFALTVKLSKAGRDTLHVQAIQIILVNANTIDEVLAKFDIDCCAVAATHEFDGAHHTRFVALPRAIEALRTRVNIYRHELVGSAYAKRACKYISRCYDLCVPLVYSGLEKLLSTDLKTNDNCLLAIVMNATNSSHITSPESHYTDEYSIKPGLKFDEAVDTALLISERAKDPRKAPIVTRLRKGIMWHESPEMMGRTRFKSYSEERKKDGCLSPNLFTLTPTQMKEQGAQYVNKSAWPTLPPIPVASTATPITEKDFEITSTQRNVFDAFKTFKTFFGGDSDMKLLDSDEAIGMSLDGKIPLYQLTDQAAIKVLEKLRKLHCVGLTLDRAQDTERVLEYMLPIYHLNDELAIAVLNRQRANLVTKK